MKQTKYLETLTALNITFQLVSDVIAGKLVHFFGHTVSVSVLFFPFTFIISDILTEVYGYKEAKKVIKTTLLCSILAGVLYQLAVFVQPSPFFEKNEAYAVVLGTVPRILIAGWIAIYIGELSNNYVLSRLKVLTEGKHLWLRTINSTVIGQGLNTGIFYVIGFHGILPTPLLLTSILVGWTFKIMVEVLMTPIVYAVVKALKNVERPEMYEYKRTT